MAMPNPTWKSPFSVPVTPKVNNGQEPTHPSDDGQHAHAEEVNIDRTPVLLKSQTPNPNHCRSQPDDGHHLVVNLSRFRALTLSLACWISDILKYSLHSVFYLYILR